MLLTSTSKHLHLTKTILWSPAPRPQLWGLVPRPQIRRPEGRSRPKLTEPFVTVAKRPAWYQQQASWPHMRQKCPPYSSQTPNHWNTGSVPGPERSLGKGNGRLFRYSCLKIPMDREAWRATVHRVTKSQTGLGDWTTTIFCGTRVKLRDQTLQKPSDRNSLEQQGSL